MKKKATKSLTWFEEWMCFFERLWGRSISRWSDARRKYKLSERQLTVLFDKKVRMINNIREMWGHFATYQEDTDLCHPNKWCKDFKDIRLIMWDNTNVPLRFMPSTAEAQRNTYSAYYGGNVGKGGIFLQPCGWMGTHELWMGATSDTEYMLKSGVFELQDWFLPNRDPLSKHVSWMNMLDKGYRNLGGYAYKCGKQLVVQPTYMKSDRRFSQYDTLRTSSVAAVRAANERAVKYMKNSKYISSGLQANEGCVRLCNVWLCWGFVTNFIYRPVH
jgi:DDE superfamily endonuclease